MILDDLTTPNQALSFFTFSRFSNLVRATTEFDLLPANFVDYPELCPVHNCTKNDIQIVYSEENGEGHATTIFFDAAKNTVFVYDEPCMDMNMPIINKRYPNSPKIKFVDRKTKQTRDDGSCGLYAIAYATNLILGHDPRTRELKATSILTRSLFSKNFDYSGIFRQHIFKMFTEKRLSPFPQ